jgi:hypothetical protein
MIISLYETFVFKALDITTIEGSKDISLDLVLDSLGSSYTDLGFITSSL